VKTSTHTRITQHAAKKRKLPERVTPGPWRRSVPILLVLILLCGLALRLSGLSHGLAENEVYHPDTPRNMWASRQFLEGTYFFRVNNLDYDGYPYFYSHIVEYLWRGARAVPSFFSHLLLGAEHSGEPLPTERLTNILFWLARLTNVALSTLAILVVYRIAARLLLDSATGLIAAALLAISPMNIATAHFATNDTMVVFFATLAVLFALRIYTAGLWLDYLLGGAATACAFSAKYQGGIVVLTCLLAHILRYWPPRKTFTREALSKLALMAIAFFIILLLANPSLLVSPGKAFHDFRKYCQYIPNARLTPSQMQLGFFARAILSFKLNTPILLRCMGPVISVIALVGLIHAFFRGKKLAVLASLPALYLVLTFLSKPIQQRFYLAALFPTMFLLAAAFLVKIARMKKIKAAASTAAGVVLFVGAFYLAKSSLKEAFFFAHRDTRKCAKEWATENIPPFYKIKSGDYTFTLDRPQKDPSGYLATVSLSSSLRPPPLPQGSFLLKAFDLEEDALPKFRNPRIEIHSGASALLSEGFALPVYQRIPSQASSEFIFADGATFYRDVKMIEFGGERRVSKVLVSSKPIDSAIVIVKNGSLPGSASIRIGGVSRTFLLGPCGTGWREFKGLRKSFPSSRSHNFYKISASGSVSGTVALMATTEEEKGVALYNIGEYGAAYPFLLPASRTNDSPVLAAMAYISGRLSLSSPSAEEEKSLVERASVLSNALNPETIASAFGVSLDYLDSLPYLSFKPYKNTSEGFHSVPDASASGDSAAVPDLDPFKPATWVTGTPPLTLEPGCYVATLRIRAEATPDPDATIKVCLLERHKKVTIAEKDFSVRSIAGSYSELQFPFEKPMEVGECWVVLRSDRYVPIFLDRIEIRPDPLKSLMALQRLLKIVSSTDDLPPTAGPLDYKPLLLFGEQRLAQDQPGKALTCYLVAHQLRPDLAEPIRRIRRVLTTGIPLSDENSARIEQIMARAKKQTDAVETGDASVVFNNGIKLTGYAMNRSPFRPGDEIDISLRWSVPRTQRIPKEIIVWMHLLDQNGKKILQLDHYLSEDLAFLHKPERIAPLLNHKARIPTLTRLGKYRLEMGLWIPLRDQRLQIADTTLPHARDSLTLREIVIEAP